MPSIDAIVRWRAALSDKYRDQLGEPLAWDEASALERSEDVGTSADFHLRYVAAVLDKDGPVALRALSGATQPLDPSADAVFAEARRRGFGGGFPQLLLGAKYWLPYDRHLIMEEPNWRGDVERYGSLFQLRDEIARLRGRLSDAKAGSAAVAGGSGSEKRSVLAGAWQASEPVSRLCAAAIAGRLPLWTTG